MARNLRIGRDEIDIVARDGTVVAIVEVRTRGAGAWTTAFGSIDRGKRRRLRRAGTRLWRQRFKSDGSVERLRFDAASVVLDQNGGIEHIEYARAAF